jgi:hypothetical protein
MLSLRREAAPTGARTLFARSLHLPRLHTSPYRSDLVDRRALQTRD